MTARDLVRRGGQWLANKLQPRIARELRAERPDIHDARQRVHYVVLMTELARLRRFPARRQESQ